MVAAGKRLAKTLRSSTGGQSTRSFSFNDNGSMIDVRCTDRAGTFQPGVDVGTPPPEDPELASLRGPGGDLGVRDPTSRLRRRQNETDSWSGYGGDLGWRTAWSHGAAERLPLAPLDVDANSFRMWSPLPTGELASNCRLSDVDYEPIRIAS